MQGGGHQPLNQILTAINGLPHANSLAIGISLAVLMTIQLFERFIPKFPGALLAVVVAIVASWQFNFASRGVTVVGAVPSGLPSFGLPAVDLSEIPQLVGIDLSCCIVITAQSAATSRAYAFRYNEGFNENVDLEGLAAANLAAGLTGTFVVNGSPTKTEIVDTAGGRSQVAQLATVAVVLIFILFLSEEIESLTPPVRWFILEARAITQIDYSASLTIRDVAQDLATQNVTFVISGLPPEVKRQFDRDGLTDLIGAERFFNHLEEALAAFHSDI